MAKNVRKLLAMVLVMCMLVSALPLQALAAEGDYEFTKTDTFTGSDVKIETNDGVVNVSGTNEKGGALDITGTTESKTSTSEDGTLEKTASETKLSGTESSDGTDKKVSYQENATQTTETAEDGTVIEQTIVDGLEKKEWNEYEVEVGQDVPSVQVQLQPGVTNSNSGYGSYTKEEDHVEGGSTAANSDKTNTTVEVDRVVEGTLSDVGVTVEKSEAVLKPAVNPLPYDPNNGKTYADYVMKQDSSGNNYVDPNGLMKGDYTDFNVGKVPAQSEEADKQGYDFYASGLGDITDAAAPVWMELVYNADGSINWEESKYVDVGYIAGETGMKDQVSTIVVMDKNGNKFYTYCIDNDTPVEANYWYRVANLEDNDYYGEGNAAQIRAIVQNGYWGTESGTGSIDEIKALLTEYAKEHPTVTVTDETGEPVEITLTAELIDGLKEHEALAVTQSAIWSYANGSSATQSGTGIVGVASSIKYYSSTGGNLLQYGRDYDLNSDARLAALYDCLMNLGGISADEAPTTIINENHNFKDMYLTVNEKVVEQGDKDVYSVDLQFTLDFELNVDDKLTVRLTDADGNNIKDAKGNDIVIEKNLAVKDSDRDDGTALVADENGVYTLTGLELSEGTDISFSLTLDGEQTIEEGVYVYQPLNGRDNSQTLVGLASGTQDVNVTVTSTLSFQAEERTHNTEERVWHHAFDPVKTPPEQPEQPTWPTWPTWPNNPQPNNPQQPAEPAEPAAWTAPENQRLANDEAVEIPEEPVPLASPVITGDDTGLWIMALLLIACGMVAVNVFDKKRHHETF